LAPILLNKSTEFIFLSDLTGIMLKIREKEFHPIGNLKLSIHNGYLA